MAVRAERPDPHTAVMRELLVRYLDAWTPAVLRSHRRATYVETVPDDFATSALRVFGEFADRLTGHQLDVVILGSLTTALTELGAAPGLSLRSVADPADLTVTGPVLAHLDVGAGALDEPTAWRLVASLGPGKAREVLLALPPAAADEVTEYRTRLRAAGLPYAVTVELADDDRRVRLLLFATSSDKHLATFKNELWAADEFAGIRYRDPRDAEHSLVDISLTPQLLPLRRALLDELARRGTCTVADLQHHTLHETIYRPADTVGVLTSAASSGAITREPAKGRLSPRTVVSRRP
ncbi:hypothetical protein [Actinophytocola algeriensis]|uniref:Three-Cys-motif partner protein TcmP n=2 Tax=Actinophytocola algeriensis TaxID=1768010 RepID=A0A7W7VCK8_9PSEU|nr:hypothetical protein [Actinophytocola algeriensis]MBB4905070.1 hypothetical protein [Actinophytocola algeriensis]MBE1473245.1 hypothetical protein [Actinophytocola algeriensis]